VRHPWWGWRWLAQLGHDTAAQPGAVPALTAEYERFLHEHERPVLNYLWRMTGDESAAYDLTQETFLRAWQRFEAIRRYEQPRSWLFRVATNLALTYLKRRRLALSAWVADDEADTLPSGSDPMARVDESDAVRRTLLWLSPRRRAALVLREVYGLSASEVGRVLGISDAAVRMELFRGRAQFRALYLGEGSADDGQ
jgi:RNA polymerase sigma-70 factor (ECF subfamily)